MPDPNPQRRWYRPTPAWLVLGLLVVEGMLWLSKRFQCFGFNEKKGWTVLIAVGSVGVVLMLMLLSFLVALVFRWRFQFSIRSLLALVIVVALPFSWLAVEMKAARVQHEAVEEIAKLPGGAIHDSEMEPLGRTPPFSLEKVLGNDFFEHVPQLILSDDAQMEPLQGLSGVQEAYLVGDKITDAGMSHLAGLTQLRLLYLNGTKVRDAGLQHLERLTLLQVIHLGNARITDTGLQHLAGLIELHVLDLSETQVTDVGMKQLTGLTHLQELSVYRTQVTDEGVKKLQQALPNCKIWH
jgi:hypothetical protein